MRGGLHGGSHLRHSWSDHWYRYQDGLMRNGLTVITFFLTDAADGDGGFACVPGSHKSNYLDLLPPDVRNYSPSAAAAPCSPPTSAATSRSSTAADPPATRGNRASSWPRGRSPLRRSPRKAGGICSGS